MSGVGPTPSKKKLNPKSLKPSFKNWKKEPKNSFIIARRDYNPYEYPRTPNMDERF
jgi:hypothetical protein